MSRVAEFSCTDIERFWNKSDVSSNLSSLPSMNCGFNRWIHGESDPRQVQACPQSGAWPLLAHDQHFLRRLRSI